MSPQSGPITVTKTCDFEHPYQRFEGFYFCGRVRLRFGPSSLLERFLGPRVCSQTACPGSTLHSKNTMFLHKRGLSRGFVRPSVMGPFRRHIGTQNGAKRTHNRRTGGPRGAILNTPHSVLKDFSFRGWSRYGHPDRNLQCKNTGNLHGEGFSKLQIWKADFYSFPIPILTDFEANFI